MYTFLMNNRPNSSDRICSEQDSSMPKNLGSRYHNSGNWMRADLYDREVGDDISCGDWSSGNSKEENCCQFNLNFAEYFNFSFQLISNQY
ncbi:unnamed protein product [Moneuplotes crassus]|uniref:Uncharacterized protein n=1 Tax=Euplotes crassus TaxID=5936 RepID=A0AAD1X660_EUPCR|nr:unnamed protein product [Moneuplotes crassus]